MNAHLDESSGSSSQPPRYTIFSVRTMTDKPQQTKGQDDVLSSLNAAIDALNIAKKVSSITPANVAFSSTGGLLILIRVCLLPVHVGRLLAEMCRTR